MNHPSRSATTLRQVCEGPPPVVEEYDRRLCSPALLRMNGALGFGSPRYFLIKPTMHVMGEAFECSGERLFGKWCVCEEVGEAWSREPLDVPAAEIPKDVVKAGRRLPTNDVVKARLELVLKCQPRELSQDRALFVLRDSIETDADDVHRDS